MFPEICGIDVDDHRHRRLLTQFRGAKRRLADCLFGIGKQREFFGTRAVVVRDDMPDRVLWNERLSRALCREVGHGLDDPRPAALRHEAWRRDAMAGTAVFIDHLDDALDVRRLSGRAGRAGRYREQCQRAQPLANPVRDPEISASHVRRYPLVDDNKAPAMRIRCWRASRRRLRTGPSACARRATSSGRSRA